MAGKKTIEISARPAGDPHCMLCTRLSSCLLGRTGLKGVVFESPLDEASIRSAVEQRNMQFQRPDVGPKNLARLVPSTARCLEGKVFNLLIKSWRK